MAHAPHDPPAPWWSLNEARAEPGDDLVAAGYTLLCLALLKFAVS